ncbi:hypothetical protein C1M51_18380 [Methylibium sp. Pch-M]|uniref:hypothetical protein n=1 Tax=Methylibium sp. Pch-M TaxID=2082386 RepID=UPI0010138CB5|nr:hypothetical protein [Methylibium sp. Pch-M]QAZ41227.1 hypothetical protein C1M51_18380 [Methylibium sp. Pch-M]
MGGKSKSSSASSSTSTQQDNRIAAEGSLIAGTGATLTSSTDSSTRFEVRDSSTKNTTTSTTTNYTGTDAAKIVELNAQLQGALAESQADSIKFIAGLGADTIKSLGESVTNLYSQAGSNTTRAYGEAIAASAPSDGKLADGFKYSAIAAAAVAALFILSRGK